MPKKKSYQSTIDNAQKMAKKYPLNEHGYFGRKGIGKAN
jgi:hypothetical protein